MAFDLSTAKPVQQGGFDLSTAQPFQQEAAPTDAPEDIFAGLPPEVISSIEERHPFRLTRPTAAGGLGVLPQRNIQEGQAKEAVLGDRKKAADFERLRIKNPFLVETIENLSETDKALIGIQTGLRTAARGTTGLLGIDTFKQDEFEKESLKELGKVSGTFGAAKLAGEAAPFLAAAPLTGTGLALSTAGRTLIPAAKTLIGRVAGGAALGATEGAAIAKGEGKEGGAVAKAGIIGGLLGSAGEILLPFVNRLGRSKIEEVTGAPPTTDAVSGNGPSPELEAALEKEGTTFDEFFKDAAEKSDLPIDQRREVFERLGLEPTEAQITRDASLFGDQSEAFVSGGKIRDVLTRQEKILSERVSGEIAKTGGNPERIVESTTFSITDKAKQLDDEISNLYKAAREAAPDAKNVRFNLASKSLAQNSPSNELSGGVVSALRSKMKNMGVIDDKFKPVGRVSVETAEELRKFSNRLSSSTNDEGKFIIREFKEALDEDALKVAGKDFFKQARAAKFNFEKGLSAESRDKFDKRNISLVRDVLDGKIGEDVLADRIINRGAKYGAKEIKELKTYLLSGSESQIAQGAQAWDDIRAAAFQNIKKRAFVGPVSDQGTQSLSRAGLQSALETIGTRKFNVLFNSSEKEFIKNLSAVAALKEAPPGVRPSPSGPAVRKLQEALGKVRWIGGGLASDIIDAAKTKGKESKLLKLTNQAESIARREEKLINKKLRESTAGRAAATAPILVTPLIVEEDK